MNEKLTREDVLGHRDYWFKAPKTVDPRTSAELVAICDLALSALDAQATDTRLREIAARADEAFRWLNRLKMDPYTQSAVNDLRKAIEAALASTPAPENGEKP